MLDGIVEGGMVVLPGVGCERVDLLIGNGKVVGLVANGSRSEARSRFDARGLHILPGAIDPHVHIGVEQQPAEDYYTESCAAAAGGVTTFLDMYQERGSYRETYARRVELINQNSVVDVGLHFEITTKAHLEDLDGYIRRLGQRTFKFRMHHRGVEKLKWNSDFPIDDGFLFRVLRIAAAAPEKVRVLLHCQNVEIAPSPYRLNESDQSRYRSTGLQLWRDMLAGPAEAFDMVKGLFLGEATSASVYIAHVSTKEAARKLYEIDRRRQDAFTEACLGYLTMTTSDDVGLLAKTNPPVAEREDRDALWRAVLDGQIDTIGTDHCAMKLTRKLGGGDLFSAALGFPAIATFVPTVLTEAHHNRGLGLHRVVELMSTNAARIFGLYPCKGTLCVGADADLVGVNLGQERAVRAAELPGWSGFLLNEGRMLKGWPVFTLVRGEAVWQDGKIRAPRGHGRYVGGLR